MRGLRGKKIAQSTINILGSVQRNVHFYSVFNHFPIKVEGLWTKLEGLKPPQLYL